MEAGYICTKYINFSTRLAGRSQCKAMPVISLNNGCLGEIKPHKTGRKSARGGFSHCPEKLARLTH